MRNFSTDSQSGSATVSKDHRQREIRCHGNELSAATSVTASAGTAGDRAGPRAELTRNAIMAMQLEKVIRSMQEANKGKNETPRKHRSASETTLLTNKTLALANASPAKRSHHATNSGLRSWNKRWRSGRRSGAARGPNDRKQNSSSDSKRREGRRKWRRWKTLSAKNERNLWRQKNELLRDSVPGGSRRKRPYERTLSGQGSERSAGVSECKWTRYTTSQINV